MRITKHAYKKAKQRMRWNSHVVEKMATIALKNGKKHEDCRSFLLKHLDKLSETHNFVANNMRIYGQDIFLFKGTILITIYRLPNSLIKYL